MSKNSQITLIRPGTRTKSNAKHWVLEIIQCKINDYNKPYNETTKRLHSLATPQATLKQKATQTAHLSVGQFLF